MRRRSAGISEFLVILCLLSLACGWRLVDERVHDPGASPKAMITRVTIHGLGLSDDADAVERIVKNYKSKSQEFMRYENGLFAYGLDENGLFFGADGVEVEYGGVKLADENTPRKSVLDTLGPPSQTATKDGEVRDYYQVHKLAIFYQKDGTFASASLGHQAIRVYRAGLL
jgi:hypothetical protein